MHCPVKKCLDLKGANHVATTEVEETEGDTRGVLRLTFIEILPFPHTAHHTHHDDCHYYNDCNTQEDND